MYATPLHEFVPVPTDRPLTGEERKWKKFAADEIVYVKGMSFKVQLIEPRRLVLEPVE